MRHQRAQHPQAPATRMLPGEGMQQSCSHLRPVPATTQANVGSAAGRGVAQCITPQLYFDLGGDRSLVLAGALEEGAGSSKRSWFTITWAEPLLAGDE